MHTRTATVLLNGLHDPANEEVWREFDARFRPILFGFACKLGLDHADATDVAQEALTRFLTAYREGRYQRQRGRLSSWLIGIARNCIVDLQRKVAAGPHVGGVSAIGELPDRFRMTAIWEAECEQQLLTLALDALRTQTRADPQTLRAFEMLCFQNRAPADVAEALGMSLNSVYLAKNRSLTRLRAIVLELTESIEPATEGPLHAG